MPKRKLEYWYNEFLNSSAKIPYDIYVRILDKKFGITEEKRSHSGGSKRSFVINDTPFVIHEPHSKKDYVGKWDHQNVLDLLKRKGKI